MLNNNLEYQIRQVLREHPRLSYDEQSRMFSGIIIVDDEDDYYYITIDIKSFPQRFPVVMEIGERIKPIADNHKSSDNNCCLTVPVKEQVILRKGLIKTIPHFINKIVVPFFQNNSFREINGDYKTEEYSHGIPGLIEAYSDILGIRDTELTRKILIHYLNGKSYGKNNPCFCGSGKKFKDCHSYRYKNLNLIERNLIIADLKLLAIQP